MSLETGATQSRYLAGGPASYDVDNFSFVLGKWSVIMKGGALEINGCSYEHNEDDPTYDFVRQLQSVIDICQRGY